MEAARAVLVGSRHTAESLWETVDVDGLAEKTRLGPPGVDVEAFAPLPAAPIRPPSSSAWRRTLESAQPGGLGRDLPAAAAAVRAYAARRAADHLRRQADRLEGLRPAARRLAAGRGPPPRGAAADGRLRRVPGGAAAAGAGPGRRRPRRRPRGRPPRLGARGRRGSPAGPAWRRSSPIRPPATPMPPARPPARSTGPAGSSTPEVAEVGARERRDGRAEHVPGGVRHGRRRGAPRAERCRSAPATRGSREVAAALAADLPGELQRPHRLPARRRSDRRDRRPAEPLARPPRRPSGRRRAPISSPSFASAGAGRASPGRSFRPPRATSGRFRGYPVAGPPSS